MKKNYYTFRGIVAIKIKRPKSKKKRIQRKWAKKIVMISEEHQVPGETYSGVFVTHYNDVLYKFNKLI